MKQRLYSLWVVAVAIIGINVHVASAQGLQVATFEDLALEPESYWFYDADNNPGSYTSGSFSFNNQWADYGGFIYAEGFYYSNLTLSIPDTTDWNNYYASVPGKGVEGSDNFAVLYHSDYFTSAIALASPAVVPGVYVANNLAAYASMKNGDSHAGDSFGAGDYFMVSFMNQPVESDDADFKRVDFYLADYTSDNPEEHYILTGWEWLDLSPLGVVDSIYFAFAGSRTGQWGLDTPTYLCLDNVGASQPTVSLDRPQMAASVIYCVGGKIYIDNNPDDYQVYVYSSTGSRIYAGQSSGNTSIDASSWVRGIYIVEVLSAEGRQIKKIVK